VSDIFLSYNREDQQAAERFARAFEAGGLSVWWDVAIRSGEIYDEVTEAALRGAGAVVVLWSKKSVASRWVRSEATLAQRAGTLAPVMIEPCERPVMFELSQTADLSQWKGDPTDPSWLAFVADVERLAGRGGDLGSTPVQLARGAEFKLPSKPSLAVMPFVGINGAEEEYFADGVVEEISTVLSRFSSLFVIAGQSSLSYRGTTKSAQQIARELGVRYLLEGSVRKASGRVRISAKLVDAIAGEQIWADRFEDAYDDLFELQDRVANAVASTIDSTIGEAEMRRSVSRPASSLDAYELTVHANALLGRYDRPSVEEALALAEKAAALDPTYAWAIAIVGFCHATLALHGWCEDPAACREFSVEMARKAMKLAGDDQMALTATAGLLITAADDIGLASRLIERALSLNPEKAFILFWAGWVDAEAGRFGRGLKRLEKAIRLNPRSIYRPFQLLGMANCLFGLDRYGEAALVAREVLRVLPQNPPPHIVHTASLALGGHLDEARAASERMAPVCDLETGLHYYRNEEIRKRIRRAMDALSAAESSWRDTRVVAAPVEIPRQPPG
jgi:TolB-like protein